MAERRKSNSPQKYTSNMSDSNVQTVQRFSFTHEDVFNYLYGYLPIQLVHPAQLQREKQCEDEGAAVPWCDICSEKHEGECPMHGPLHSLRKLVSAGQSNSPLENGSVLKFPDEVCLCTSSIPCMGYGVCARKRIPAGTWIGPYEGKLMRPEDIKTNTDTEYMWEVFHDGQVSHYLDGKDEINSSWMRFVHCARHKKEQNMVVFQYHGCVYYRTIQDILPGQELLVWYDSRYSQFMGVPVALNDSGSRGVQPPRDLVAQDRARARDKLESGDPPAKRLQLEHDHPVYTHSPPQRGRPPLRRTETENRRKTEIENGLKFFEEQQLKQAAQTRRPLSYRGRGRGRGSHISSHRVADPADDFTWRCNKCFKAFSNREQLELHHCNGLSGGKNYTCPHCNQTFSHPAEFRTHVETHVNERPFRCGYCASAFTSATLLNQHVRVHMTEIGQEKSIGRQERIIQAQEFSF